MKKFENLGKTLSKAEQKNIIGGDYEGGGAGPFFGKCTGGSEGCWHYTEPVTWQTCLNDIALYCSSGSGVCSLSNNCL